VGSPVSRLSHFAGSARGSLASVGRDAGRRRGNVTSVHSHRRRQSEVYVRFGVLRCSRVWRWWW